MASGSDTAENSVKIVSLVGKEGNKQEALQIFRFQKEELILEKDNLQLLKHDEIKDCKVCIISVNGSFRTGKSFLLSIFAHCLRQKCQSVQQEWMKTGDILTREFLWKKTEQRVTDGILIFPEIFLTKTKDGEKIAIILMDTQGTSDHRISDTVCTKIFALSALISSVQIYNVQKRLNLDDLKILQLFTGYGAMFSNPDIDNSDNKPFQDLLILIRDWINFEEFDFGFDGGNKLLESKFEEHKQSNLSEIQQTIEDNFEKVRCFLMPHPGEKVEEKKFEGHFEDIGEKFRVYVKTFVDNLLTPENLVAKKINHEFVTVENLLAFINTYWKHINRARNFSIKTIYMANAEISLQQRMEQMVEQYKANLRCCEIQEDATVEKSKILDSFKKTREMKLGTDELRKRFEQRLTKLLDEVYNNFLTLLNNFDELKTEYTEFVKQWRQSSEAEKQLLTILTKFEKLTKNLNCEQVLRYKFGQRLKEACEEIYENNIFEIKEKEFMDHSKYSSGGGGGVFGVIGEIGGLVKGVFLFCCSCTFNRNPFHTHIE
ncbi:atlastin-like [Zophobas morio]|uniref:atlastin-like n=1 Tax=Zophobas morio TaxID=2755281 RepID=UPI003082E8EC